MADDGATSVTETTTEPTAETTTETTIGDLNMILHLVSGKQEEFRQTDSETIQHILDQIRPERFFTQKHLLFSGGGAVSVIPTESVEWAEIRADPLPDWPQRSGIADLEVISAEEFARIQHEEQDSATESGRPPATIAVLVEMRSGASTHYRFHPVRPAGDLPPRRTGDDASLLLTHLFSRPVLFGKTEDGKGLFLLNPANAVQFTIVPGPPAPAGAWAMELVFPE